MLSNTRHPLQNSPPIRRAKRSEVSRLNGQAMRKSAFVDRSHRYFDSSSFLVSSFGLASSFGLGSSVFGSAGFSLAPDFFKSSVFSSVAGGMVLDFFFGSSSL